MSSCRVPWPYHHRGFTSTRTLLSSREVERHEGRGRHRGRFVSETGDEIDASTDEELDTLEVSRPRRPADGVWSRPRRFFFLLGANILGETLRGRAAPVPGRDAGGRFTFDDDSKGALRGAAGSTLVGGPAPPSTPGLTRVTRSPAGFSYTGLIGILEWWCLRFVTTLMSLRGARSRDLVRCRERRLQDTLRWLDEADRRRSTGSAARVAGRPPSPSPRGAKVCGVVLGGCLSSVSGQEVCPMSRALRIDGSFSSRDRSVSLRPRRVRAA